MRFADSHSMSAISKSIRRALHVAGRMFSRTFGLIIGFVMIALGLAMTITIVMLPVGVVIGLLGVAILVVSLFARDTRGAPQGRQ